MTPRPSDIATALSLLTRLPASAANPDRGAAAAWAWPIAGLAVGAIGAAALGLSLASGLPASLAAGLGLGAMVLATGALHEDGLADTADGLWGGWTRDRRLEIMKDSAIGTYGVLALVFVAGLRWSALAALAGADCGAEALITAAVVSRAAMAPVATLLPHARPGGLSVRTGRPSGAVSMLGVALAAGVALTALGWLGIAAGLAAGGAALAVGSVAKARIGGQTGDILGATQQMAEVAILLVLVALAL